MSFLNEIWIYKLSLPFSRFYSARAHAWSKIPTSCRVMVKNQLRAKRINRGREWRIRQVSALARYAFVWSARYNSWIWTLQSRLQYRRIMRESRKKRKRSYGVNESVRHLTKVIYTTRLYFSLSPVISYFPCAGYRKVLESSRPALYLHISLFNSSAACTRARTTVVSPLHVSYAKFTRQIRHSRRWEWGSRTRPIKTTVNSKRNCLELIIAFSIIKLIKRQMACLQKSINTGNLHGRIHNHQELR